MTTSPHGDYADLQPTVGDRLRLARERRTGLDQGDFADHIGVSRGTVSNYERDRLPGGPRQRLVLNAWAQATGTTREWLESGIETSGPPSPDPNPPKIEETDDQLAALTAKKMRRQRASTAEYSDAA